MAELRHRFNPATPPTTDDTAAEVVVGKKGKNNDAVEKKAVAATSSSDIQPEILPFKRRSKRRNGFIFGLGGIFGVLLAVFFANQNEVISLDALLDLNLDALIDVIPAGIVKDAKEFSVSPVYHLDRIGLSVVIAKGEGHREL